MPESQSETSVFRILDAAINRAGEGIRVVEDFLRMTIGDAYLAGRLKSLRHELTESTSGIDPVKRMAARDSVGDVGRNLKTDAEYKRADSFAMVQANFGRVQQALRSIEEFSKTLSADIAGTVEQLRYRAYTLEKAVMTMLLSLKTIGDARLCVLIDCRDSESELQSLVTALVEAEVGLIQLRDKSRSDRELIASGKTLSKLTRDTNTRWVMNDRADLAFASGADGVHLGQDDMPVASARRIVGAAKLIGVSTHNIEQARQAVLVGANYLGVGPVFESTTKAFDSYAGLAFVKEVADEIQLPSFAIGGIHRGNIAQVCEAGLKRVAVSSAVIGSSDAGLAARELRSKLS